MVFEKEGKRLLPPSVDLKLFHGRKNKAIMKLFNSKLAIAAAAIFAVFV